MLQGLLSSKVAVPLLLCTQVWRAQVVGLGGARPSTSSADFASLQCGQDGKQLHPGPCNLQAVSQRFEEGHYKSVVSGTQRNQVDARRREGWGWAGSWILTSPLTAQLHGGCGEHPDGALGRRRTLRASGWRPDEGAPIEGELLGDVYRVASVAVGRKSFTDPLPANSPGEASSSHPVTHSSAARVYVRLVRRPRPQVLATEYPAAKVSKAGWQEGNQGVSAKAKGNLGDKEQSSCLENSRTRMTVPSGCRLAKIQTVELALSFYLVQGIIGDSSG